MPVKKAVRFKKLVITSLALSTVIVTIFVWYSRMRLGLIRYFDTDEFIYPNYAYHILKGSRPYTDFMMLVTPVYVLLNLPLVAIKQTADPLIYSRVLSFLITVLLALSLGFLFYRWKKSWLALLVPLLISILPMPSDKFMEIRPDTLSVTFLIIGLCFLLLWLKAKKNTLFLTGFFFSLSLLTLQKNLPQIALCVLAVFFYSRKEIARVSIFRWSFLKLLLGFSIPVFVFLIWALLGSGNPGLVIYSVARLPVEHAQMYRGKMNLFWYFLPIVTYYGQWGWSLASIGNHIIWILGALIALLYLKEEFLFSALCLGSILLYFTSPIIFPQYLIPAACFVVLFFAQGINAVFQKLSSKKSHLLLFSLCYLILLTSLYQIYQQSHAFKFSWTNREVLAKMNEIFSTIPKNEYVLDMEGRTLYYPYPYYLCCLSFEIPNFISFYLPSLTEALLKTKTKYIYQGPIERINFLSPLDRTFVLDNYTKSPDGQFFIAKTW